MSKAQLSPGFSLSPSVRSPAAVSSAIRANFPESLRSRNQSTESTDHKSGILKRLQFALLPAIEKDYPEPGQDSKTESQEDVFGTWQPISSKTTRGLSESLRTVRRERYAHVLMALKWFFFFLLFISCILILVLLCLPTRPAHRSALYGRSSASSPLFRPGQRLTRGVIPLRLASHNDYDQLTPLFDALSSGATSIEVDVILKDGQVLVGHEEDELDPARSLASLYAEPLQLLLEMQNQGLVEGEKPVGLFDLDPDQTLQLLIDCKVKDTPVLAAVTLELEGLRAAGYLSKRNANNTNIEISAITVVASGECTLEEVKSLPTQDIFYDAPLNNLIGVDAIWSPMASADLDDFEFSSLLPTKKDPVEAMAKAVRQAHALGIAARFWGAPKWPERLRDNALQATIDVGADWLNVDDLAAGAQF